MEELEVILKGKSKQFIKLIKKMFRDYDINKEEGVKILKDIYMDKNESKLSS